MIYGLSLVSAQPADTPTEEIPPAIQQWLDQALAESKVKELVDYESPAFFSNDTARLVGYLKGYDPRAGFSTGIIYAENVLTRESHPIVVEIYEDGRFEAQIPMRHSIYTGMFINRRPIPFYLEPGQTLSMVIDWAEFLAADRQRNIRYEFHKMVYAGPLARINDELLKTKPTFPDYSALKGKIQQMTPADFKREQVAAWKEAAAQLEAQFAQQALLPQTKTLQRTELMLSYSNYLFDFMMNRRFAATKDSTNEILKVPADDHYYDFLQELPLDRQTIVVPLSFSTFINRFEYCDLFMESSRVVNELTQPKRSLNSFLFEQLNLTPSKEDQEFLALEQSLKTRLNQPDLTDSAQRALLKHYMEKSKAFTTRYVDEVEMYTNEYIKTLPTMSPGAKETIRWQAKDSLLQKKLKLPLNFTYAVAKVRSLASTFEQQLSKNKDDARVFLTTLENGMDHPFLLSEAERIFQASFPDTPKQAYELPEEKGTTVFRKLITPHKGKFIFVDFWATSCGPCIAYIKRHKETRATYKNHPDFEFVFVTSERESPQKSYENFIAEQDLQYTHRLSDDDFHLLRQLFKFNGIPRYVLIDPDGKVLNDDFPMHNFEQELNAILNTKKPVSGT